MQEMPPRRSVQSLYASQDEPEASVQPPEPVPRRRSRRRPSRTQPTTPPAVEEPAVVEEPAATMEHADAGGSSSTSGDEVTAGDEATAGGSTSSGVSTVYLRGPTKLLHRPIPEEARPLITPYGDR